MVDLGPGPAFFDGSSYSNGAAAGVGALLKHIKPDLTVLDLFTQLKSTDPVNGSLVDVAPVGWDAIYGHGRISLKAVPYPTNDTDSDGRIDIHDNCPLKANAPLFADSDQDGQGDVCDNTCGASAPITVSSASDTTPGGGVVVNGSGFGGWDQIELIGSSTVAVQNVVLQSTSQLPGLVPAGTATGTYAVRVFRSAGCESQETTELNVTQESCGIGFELVAIVGFFVCERRMRKRGAHAKGMSR